MLNKITSYLFNNKLKSLKDKHKNQRCFILGNGPSLTKLDLKKLEGEITIASNGIFFLFDTNAFRPTYYTAEDNLVAEDRAREINHLTGFTKIFPEDLKYTLNKNENTIFIKFIRGCKDSGYPNFSKDLSDCAHTGGTVSYLNLQLAWYLGCKEVYLIGVDHNYLIPENLDKNGIVWTSQEEDPNHFHPNYFGKGYRWHDPRTDRMERSYIKAKMVFEEDNRKIYNSTLGGKLEVFERINYDNLFKS